MLCLDNGILVDVCDYKEVETLDSGGITSFLTQYSVRRHALFLLGTRCLCMAFIRRYTLYIPLPSCLLALALCLTRCRVRLRLVIRNTKLPGHNDPSLLPDSRALVWRSIRLSSPTRKLQHARLCSRSGTRRRCARNTHLRQCIQSFSSRFRCFPIFTWSIQLLLFLLRRPLFQERDVYARILRLMAMVLNNVSATSLEN